MHKATHRTVAAAYEAFKRKTFPETSLDEEANHLHAELVLLDTEWNGLIQRAIGASFHPRGLTTLDEW